MRLLGIALLTLGVTSCTRYEYIVGFVDPHTRTGHLGQEPAAELKTKLPGCSLTVAMAQAAASTEGRDTTAKIGTPNDGARAAALITAARSFHRDLVLDATCNEAETGYRSAHVETPGANVAHFVERDHLPRALAGFPVILSSLALLFCAPMAFGAFDKYPDPVTRPNGESFKHGGAVCSAAVGGVLAASIGVMVWDPTIDTRLDQGVP